MSSCAVSAAGDVQVRLRLPTYFCAPNFAFLMVADAYDAVSGVGGVRHAEVILEDHFASGAIAAGVAARAGFVQSFGALAAAELDELRTDFVRKAVLAGTDRVCRPLLADGRSTDDLAELTLGDVPPSPDLDRLRSRRAELGLPADDGSPLLVDAVSGEGIGAQRCRCTCAGRLPGQSRGQRQHLRRDAAAPLWNRRAQRIGGGPIMPSGYTSTTSSPPSTRSTTQGDRSS